MKKKMKNNMTRKSFSRGRLKVRMMFLGTCIGRYGPVDYSSVFGGIGSHSHRVFGRFVRGSREISPAPSLYRESTDSNTAWRTKLPGDVILRLRSTPSEQTSTISHA